MFCFLVLVCVTTNDCFFPDSWYSQTFFSYLSMCENTSLWLFSPQMTRNSILTLMIKYCPIFVFLSPASYKKSVLMLMGWGLIKSFLYSFWIHGVKQAVFQKFLFFMCETPINNEASVLLMETIFHTHWHWEHWELLWSIYSTGVNVLLGSGALMTLCKSPVFLYVNYLICKNLLV